MPKSIVIEPEKVFSTGAIHFSDIPVNAYRETVEEERAAHSYRRLPEHLAGHVRHPGI